MLQTVTSDKCVKKQKPLTIYAGYMSHEIQSTRIASAIGQYYADATVGKPEHSLISNVALGASKPIIVLADFACSMFDKEYAGMRDRKVTEAKAHIESYQLHRAFQSLIDEKAQAEQNEEVLKLLTDEFIQLVQSSSKESLLEFVKLKNFNFPVELSPNDCEELATTVLNLVQARFSDEHSRYESLKTELAVAEIDLAKGGLDQTTIDQKRAILVAMVEETKAIAQRLARVELIDDEDVSPAVRLYDLRQQAMQSDSSSEEEINEFATAQEQLLKECAHVAKKVYQKNQSDKQMQIDFCDLLINPSSVNTTQAQESKTDESKESQISLLTSWTNWMKENKKPLLVVTGIVGTVAIAMIARNYFQVPVKPVGNTTSPRPENVAEFDVVNAGKGQCFFDSGANKYSDHKKFATYSEENYYNVSPICNSTANGNFECNDVGVFGHINNGQSVKFNGVDQNKPYGFDVINGVPVFRVVNHEYAQLKKAEYNATHYGFKTDRGDWVKLIKKPWNPKNVFIETSAAKADHDYSLESVKYVKNGSTLDSKVDVNGKTTLTASRTAETKCSELFGYFTSNGGYNCDKVGSNALKEPGKNWN
ncbi:MAG: hypothetical protein KDK40_03905, partial [Chlamydiia bacterium]|nr:hypothetical protein [Chlamydiia bacterium]